MPSPLDTLTGSSTPGVRRPIFQLTIGSGSPDDWAERLVTARVSAGLAPIADEAALWLSHDAPAPAVGDALTLALDYEDGAGGGLAAALGALGGGSGGPVQVFAGEVVAVEPTLLGQRVVALNGGAKLQGLRIWQFYESKSAGDIVKDLASQAGVTPGAVEAGVSLPAYVVNARRHAYRHIADLARLCEFYAAITPDDELVFAPFAKTTADHTFVYAEDVLALRVEQGTPAIGQVTVIGESPASGQGQNTWPWLASDWSSYQGQAGGNGANWLVQDRAARTQEAAQSLADSLVDRATRGATRGSLRALGRPAVKVGDAVEVTGAPASALNALYQVIRVQHRLDRETGFLTTLELIAAGSGGGGLPGGLL